ncbi:MAG TPA: glycogen synthase GlgA [Oscillospiraceae bacterium]|nr:glycogen synthase GlgA [Oscillospiraceae bacterium]
MSEKTVLPRETPVKVLFATSEAAPFVKTGGLGDVSGSLPAALAALGADVRVMLPLYSVVSEYWRKQMTFLRAFYVDLSWRSLYCGVFELKRGGVTYYFIDNEHYFARGDIYGHFDDGERFGYFCRAVVESIPQLGFVPDVIHCNDWQTALIPLYLMLEGDRVPELRRIKTLYTIHNVEYQGRFGLDTLADLFGLPREWYENGLLEYYGDISLLKGALLTADAVTTVSPTYAEELADPFHARGMEGVIAVCRHKLTGILNGLDMSLYDPADDPALSRNFSVDNLAGKAENKRELQKALGLSASPETPVVACISRLVPHKGFDLIAAALPRIMQLPLQLVVLGRGDWQFEQLFRNAARQYPARLSANIMYSASLSMGIYAGADIFLMPSRSEPCGLAQMIAMRYGTVPVVREAGGLKDTVFPYVPGDEKSNGFTFASYSADDMLYVLREAVDFYGDKDVWRLLQRRGMTADFSWKRSAGQYMALYRKLAGEA